MYVCVCVCASERERECDSILFTYLCVRACVWFMPSCQCQLQPAALRLDFFFLSLTLSLSLPPPAAKNLKLNITFYHRQHKPDKPSLTTSPPPPHPVPVSSPPSLLTAAPRHRVSACHFAMCPHPAHPLQWPTARGTRWGMWGWFGVGECQGKVLVNQAKKSQFRSATTSLTPKKLQAKRRKIDLGRGRGPQRLWRRGAVAAACTNIVSLRVSRGQSWTM